MASGMARFCASANSRTSGRDALRRLRPARSPSSGGPASPSGGSLYAWPAAQGWRGHIRESSPRPSARCCCSSGSGSSSSAPSTSVQTQAVGSTGGGQQQQQQQQQQPPPPLFRDRLTPGGNWVSQQPPPKQREPAQLSMRPSGTTGTPHVILANDKDGRPTFPLAAPISTAEVEQLVEFIRDSRNLLVITGAGCSTESNIPDYRSPTGAYSSGYKPMTHQQFMAKESNRSRYWQRSYAGYHEFASTTCNPAHHALAQLQEMGWVRGLITQNVDRLHHKAGSAGVVELHGTTHRVICMSCEATMDRKQLQDIFDDINADVIAAASDANPKSDPALEAAQGVKRPDGDTDTRLSQDFRVPPCEHCGGVLKPDVVFFGANVPKDRSDLALRMAEEADAILVVGSSLMVYSVYRLIKAAKAKGAGLAIVTVGPTRADDLADLKLQYLAGEALSRVARHPTLSIPPGR